MCPAAGKQVELLAPAGSLESFFAALDGGADAVYCGLKSFSARARAKNFTMAEVERLTICAHRVHKRLYLTLNTLLKERELPAFIDTLAELSAIGVDGIILQDLGAWRLARTWFPDLPLHASTQMTVHNAAGVRMLEQMGFVRAVLARELSLAEITEIRRLTSIELEHFVHGALCFSISGQCFFSSTISGMSGNRGRCAQPCRRRYHYRGKPGYFFSTSDLSAIGLLPQLIDAGVSSFKIEGRMKSAEYVARVTAAYRLVLDAQPGERKNALRVAEEHLALAFGRQTTKGFLTGSVSAGIASPAQQGTLGQRLGEIVSLREGLIGLTVEDRLHVGDRLRIQPKSDRAGSGFTVRELFAGDKGVRAARAGEFVRIRNAGGAVVQVGDAVYKVGGKPLFTLSPETCRQKLAAITLPAKPEKTVIDSTAKARSTLLPAGPKSLPPAESLTAQGQGISDCTLLEQPGIDRLQLELTPEIIIGLKKYERRLVGFQERLIWEIPPLLFGTQWQEYRRAVQMLSSRGFRTFRVENLGHIPLFEGLEGVKLLGGFRCYALNSQAILAWQELGLSELTASIEDDRDNLTELFARPLPVPLAGPVYAPLPVLISRIPFRGIRAGSILRSDRGEGYRILYRGGLTEVVGEQDFSLSGRINSLREMGCHNFFADLRHLGGTSARGREVLAALAGNRDIPGTTPLNFVRGLA